MFATSSSLSVVISVALGAVGYILYCHLSLSVQRKGEAPVRWSWIPLLGYALDMGARPIELLTECGSLFGEVFGIVVAGNRMFFISDCHSVNVILKPVKELSWEEFHHSVLIDFFGAQKSTLSAHLVNEDLMRKWFSQYLYSDVSLHVLTVRMQQQLNKSSTTFPCGTVKLFDFISKLIFKASVATLFNEEAASDPALFDAFLLFDKQLPLSAAGISISYFSNANNARKILTNACKKYTTDNSELIRKRREYFGEVGVPTEDIAVFALAMLWASVGNTMPVTFWLLYYLLNDTETLKCAIHEVRQIAKVNADSGNSKNEFTQEQLNGMIYIDACITETLRLTSGSLIMRFVKKQCDLTLSSGKTYRFRKGDRIGLCPAVTHLDDEVFHDAKRFVPSRWLTGQTDEDRVAGSLGRIPLFKNGKEIANNAAFLPFGGGSTLCPGRRFARNEIKTFVALLLTRCDLSVMPHQPVPVFDNSRAGLGIFPPKTDVQVLVKAL